MATRPATRPSEDAAAGGERTIPALWRDAVRAAEARRTPAYLVERNGAWHEVSWAEAAARVENLANGLLALGVRKGDSVGIVAATTLEWALLDFALARVGGVTAPVYPNNSPRDCAYVLDHAEAIAVFVEDEAQRAKIEETRSSLPRLRDVISFAELGELELRGQGHKAEHPDALAAAEAEVGEEDLFTYIYTSGTTGPPKACMIRHRNYFEMAAVVDELAEFLVGDDVLLLYLPLAHNFGRLLHLIGPRAGYTIAFVPDPYRVADALPHVRPTVLPSAPRVFEKVYAAVRGQFDAATGVKRRLIDWALRTGYRTSPYRQRGEQLPRPLALQHRLADKLVYSKVKARLGGRFRIGISGAAPLAKEIAEFFHALDILILEGYGLTECTTACSVNRPGRVRFGTVGPALPGSELAIGEDGEVLIRSGTIFAGYYKDDAATREVLGDDGWLRSGDIGEIDADGFLTITDRKKDIIVTAGGKNVAPQNLESALKRSPLVSQALVIGDRRPYVSALITVDPPTAGERSPDELRAELQRVVDDVNAGFSRFEQIKRFAILPRDFSLEEGEITPTLKVKRNVVQEHFAREIDDLYA